MSCLSDLKVVGILGDKTEDAISQNLSEKKYSFLKRTRKKISKNIKNRIFKLVFGNLI